MTDNPHTIRVDQFLPHPPEKVWRALTDPDLMARWLMPNDFRLEIGHKFTFRTDPVPAVGFGGIGHSEVLGFEDGKMLQIAWRAAPADPSNLDSTVTFTLHPEGSGTRLFVEHDGFDPNNPYHTRARNMLGSGWKAVGGRIAALIEESGL